MLVIGVVQLIESIAFSIPLSYFPNYAIELGASVASIGIFTSSFMLASAIISPKMGAFSDQAKVPMSTSFKALLVFSFVNGIGVGFIIPIMALFYVDKFGIEPVQIGIILSLSGFVGLFASWVAGRVSDWMGRKPLIVSGSFFSSIFGFLLPVTGDVTSAAGVLSLRMLGFNVSMPALRALRADLTPPETRGRYFGMFMTTFTAGDIVGPVISTLLRPLSTKSLYGWRFCVSWIRHPFLCPINSRNNYTYHVDADCQRIIGSEGTMFRSILPCLVLSESPSL